jgi:hydrogenase maturation protease
MNNQREGEGDNPTVLVLGLGNPLRRDDGVGPRVIEKLKTRGLPPKVTAQDGGTGGLDLIGVLEGHRVSGAVVRKWDRVVIVDAADVGKMMEHSGKEKIAPGQFLRFTADQVELIAREDRFSFHHAGLAEVLTLAQALDHPLPPIVIFGVQPQDIGWGEGLSPAVEAGLPALVDAIHKETTLDR